MPFPSTRSFVAYFILVLVVCSPPTTLFGQVPDYVLDAVELPDERIKWGFVLSDTTLAGGKYHYYLLPEIVDNEDYPPTEDEFELAAHHILVASATSSHSPRVVHHLVQSEAETQWYSDAVRLDRIELDTQDFNSVAGYPTVALRTTFSGSSRVNPYQESLLNLFILEADTLRPALRNFSLVHSSGEWDTRCAGYFETTNRRLLDTTQVLNQLFFREQRTMIETVVHPITGECEEARTVTTKTIQVPVR